MTQAQMHDAPASAGFRAGPILVSRGCSEGVHHVDAIVARPSAEPAPSLTLDGHGALEAKHLKDLFETSVWRFSLDLPENAPASYDFEGETFRIMPPGPADARIAYVSCNGQEAGDMDRPLEERDAMWDRLAAEHAVSPFALIMEGGDQLYADDVLQCHPDIVHWNTLPDEERGTMALSEAAQNAIRLFYLERYCLTYSRPAMRHLSAEVPGAMMWDDHDIIDGWGSHPAPLLDGPVGRGLFEAAREIFLLFQLGATEDDLPAAMPDRTGEGLGYALRYPGYSIVVPDLRSERRLERVLGPKGWAGLERMLAETPKGDRVFLMSSVPVMGPRLSWLEFVADWVEPARKYEDDLRDQWQSRAHREEWIRLLKLLANHQESGAGPITIVSGEIHLATRGEMRLRDGTHLHQLVSSGIAHRAPPKAYAVVLTMLARLGESPLPKRKIRLHRLPSIKTVYVEERNFMTLSRKGRDWSAEWELEDQGRTPPLQLQ
ncbi:hypothetical protein SAMN06297251_1222 [Fulvimarina manganoxydans]|uniref:PhoD-like phosphatase domain-containing protein n=1 Tax=Fulvimarina manganoxydans TaxID=937218 RepID=A0A1W2E6F8_9HYPH|nr:alkaline phosphatase D family protein [Fulvimarina manganoxydans]SMD05341.1 hypothetical protein SAMN06297251_1222 [Fulvimarina manganoxydans]